MGNTLVVTDVRGGTRNLEKADLVVNYDVPGVFLDYEINLKRATVALVTLVRTEDLCKIAPYLDFIERSGHPVPEQLRSEIMDAADRRVAQTPNRTSKRA